jgi:hypothetical protein
MGVKGIRYQYHDGSSVAITYPRQKFAEGTENAAEGTWKPSYNLSSNASPIGFSSTPQSNETLAAVNPSGTQQQSMGVGGSGNPNDPSNYSQINAAQPQSAASNTGAGGLIGGIVDNVLGIFGVGQNAASATLNRNLARKQLALSEAQSAENIHGAAQTRQQNDIKFGQDQKQLEVAKAWSSGVARGLTTGRT